MSVTCQNSRKECLLTKEEVLSFLNDVRSSLFQEKGVSDAVLEIVLMIDEIITDMQCCVENWPDVVRIYRWAYCTLDRIWKLPISDRGTYIEGRLPGYLEKLDAAHKAARTNGLRHLRGEDLCEEVRVLGFL